MKEAHRKRFESHFPTAAEDNAILSRRISSIDAKMNRIEAKLDTIMSLLSGKEAVSNQHEPARILDNPNRHNVDNLIVILDDGSPKQPGTHYSPACVDDHATIKATADD